MFLGPTLLVFLLVLPSQRTSSEKNDEQEYEVEFHGEVENRTDSTTKISALYTSLTQTTKPEFSDHQLVISKKIDHQIYRIAKP